MRSRCSFFVTPPLPANRRILALLVVAFACGPTPALAEEAGAKPSSSADSGGLAYWLTARQSYRLRDSRPTAAAAADPFAPVTGASDQDLHFALDGGLLDASGKFGGELALGLWLDVDGISGQSAPVDFASVRDIASGHPVNLYLASAHYRPGGWLKELRLGRMSAGFGSGIIFDGASMVLRPLGGSSRLEVLALGGRTAHFYETDDSYFEDWIGAIALRSRISPDLRLELDYRLMIEDSASQELDHAYGLTAHWRITEALGTRLEVGGVDDALAKVAVAGRYLHEPSGLGLIAKLDLQLATLDGLNERDDPFFAILGTSRPHLRWNLDLYEELDTASGGFVFHLGWQGREPLDGESEVFNRSHGRLHLTADAIDFLTSGLRGTVSLEYHHDGAAFDEGLLTVGGAVGHSLKNLRGLGAELGSYYQRYKYDYYADVDERQDVRTVFASAFIDALPWLEVRLRYSLEHFDRTSHSAVFTLTQKFEAGR